MDIQALYYLVPVSFAYYAMLFLPWAMALALSTLFWVINKE